MAGRSNVGQVETLLLPLLASIHKPDRFLGDRLGHIIEMRSEVDFDGVRATEMYGVCPRVLRKKPPASLKILWI